MFHTVRWEHTHELLKGTERAPVFKVELEVRNVLEI
jgi:hypothetical protein